MALERTIADFFREVLGTANVGLDENFLDLGANSLVMIRLHRRLQAVLGTTIPIVQLFQHPTIRALAEALKEKDASLASSQLLRRSSNPFHPGASATPAEQERAGKQRAAHEQLRDRLGRSREQ